MAKGIWIDQQGYYLDVDVEGMEEWEQCKYLSYMQDRGIDLSNKKRLIPTSKGYV